MRTRTTAPSVKAGQGVLFDIARYIVGQLQDREAQRVI